MTENRFLVRFRFKKQLGVFDREIINEITHRVSIIGSNLRVDNKSIRINYLDVKSTTEIDGFLDLVSPNDLASTALLSAAIEEITGIGEFKIQFALVKIENCSLLRESTNVSASHVSQKVNALPTQNPSYLSESATPSMQTSKTENVIPIQQRTESWKLLFINSYKLVFFISLILLVSLPIFLSLWQRRLDDIVISLFLLLSIGTVWGFIQLKFSEKA